MNTTITISKETKKLLEMLKGNKTWEEFLREVAEELTKRKREVARKALAQLLDTEDLERARWTRY